MLYEPDEVFGRDTSCEVAVDWFDVAKGKIGGPPQSPRLIDSAKIPVTLM